MKYLLAFVALFALASTARACPLALVGGQIVEVPSVAFGAPYPSVVQLSDGSFAAVQGPAYSGFGQIGSYQVSLPSGFFLSPSGVVVAERRAFRNEVFFDRFGRARGPVFGFRGGRYR